MLNRPVAVFALLGLQVYMGVLSQKCVRNYPTDDEELATWGNLSDENWDFFMHDWSNHIPDIQSSFLTSLANKFHEASEYIQAMGLSDMAEWDQHGNHEDENVFPFKLRFEPQLSYSEEYTDGILY